MSLAQRVRDFRYSKGWGPDELATRAEISRTALYQIESGKTGLPRAGTLRRIAMALEVSMDELLGHAEAAHHGQVHATSHARGLMEQPLMAARSRDLADWIPAEGGPLNLPGAGHYMGYMTHGRDELRGDDTRLGMDSLRLRSSADALMLREGDLMNKLQDLLHSPLGPGIARIIDELHQMLPRARNHA